MVLKCIEKFRGVALIHGFDVMEILTLETDTTYECIKEASFIHHLTKDLGLVFLPHSSMPIVFEFKVIFSRIFTYSSNKNN